MSHWTEARTLGALLLGVLLLTGCAEQHREDLRLWTIATSSQSLLALTPESQGCDDFGYQDRQIVSIAVASEDRVYGVDQSSHELVRLRPWGGGTERIGDIVSLAFPQSLAASPDGSLYLLDDNRTLIRLNRDSATRIQEWLLPTGLYASLCFSPVSFTSPTRVNVSAGDLLALRQEAGNSWLILLTRVGTSVEVQDLARLSPLQSFCGSSVDGRFYALDGTRQVLELRPEAGSLRPLYDASCTLESAGPLSTP